MLTTHRDGKILWHGSNGHVSPRDADTFLRQLRSTIRASVTGGKSSPSLTDRLMQLNSWDTTMETAAEMGVRMSTLCESSRRLAQRGYAKAEKVKYHKRRSFTQYTRI